MFGDGSWARELMLWLDSQFRGFSGMVASSLLVGLIFAFTWLMSYVMSRLRRLS